VRTAPLRDVEIDPLTGSPRRAHLVPPQGGLPGHVLVLQARIEGTPVTALCGLVLVPSHDPRSYPTCSRCLEVFRATTGAEDGWHEA
jgi:hypothetical protein